MTDDCGSWVAIPDQPSRKAGRRSGIHPGGRGFGAACP